MNLELKIKDNFLPKKLFEKLAIYSLTLEYSSKNIDSHYGNVLLSNVIHSDDNLIKDLEKSIIKHFNIKIKNLNFAAFSCVNIKKAIPHTDTEVFPNEKHLIIYLNGDPKLNTGTGFYNVIDEGIFDLHTAIGFFPNRALMFNASDSCHSPLLYAAESNSSRYSIMIWFEPEKIN